MRRRESISAFVQRQRAERAAKGQPAQIAESTVYRLLDGIMAARSGGQR